VQGGRAQWTYRRRDGRVLPQARVEEDFVVHGHGLHNLAAGDVGIRLVGQHGGDEHGLVGEVGGVVGAVEDMVAQQGGDDTRVSSDQGFRLGAVEESIERVIAGGEDGDVPCLVQRADEDGLGAEQACDGASQSSSATNDGDSKPCHKY